MAVLYERLGSPERVTCPPLVQDMIIFCQNKTMNGAMYEWVGSPKRATCPPPTAEAFIQPGSQHHTLSSSMLCDSERQCKTVQDFVRQGNV